MRKNIIKFLTIFTLLLAVLCSTGMTTYMTHRRGAFQGGESSNGLLTGLVSYWKLDESSDGSTTVNRVDSHSTYDLTDLGTTPSSTTAVFNNSAHMANANNERLNTTSPVFNGVENDFSVSFWIDPDGNIGTNLYIFYFRYATPTVATWFFANVGGSMQLSTPLGNVTTSWNGADDGNFHHIVITHDVGNELKVYVDASATTNSSITTSPAITGWTQTTFGGYSSGGDYNGKMDEIGYWSRVLSATDVSALYASGSGLPYSSFD